MTYLSWTFIRSAYFYQNIFKQQPTKSRGKKQKPENMAGEFNMIPSQKFIKPSKIVLDINDLNNVINESVILNIYVCI